MKNSLDIIASTAELGTSLFQKTQAFGRKGLEGAVNTQRAYRADIKLFEAWCLQYEQIALPVSVVTLAMYMTFLAETSKWASLNRKLAATRKYHLLAGLELPTKNADFKLVMEGIKRTIGIRQQQAPAFKLAFFKQQVKLMDSSTLTGLRNKAIILLGFTGAFRRSELARIQLDNLLFSEDGIIVTLPNSKTNQYGEAEEKAIFYSPDPQLCPVRTLENWIKTAKLTDSLFVRIRKGDKLTNEQLSDKSINDIFQAYFGKKYSAHSLRASFITIAKINGADDSEIMRQTKHKTPQMIQRYTRIDDIKIHNAGLKLGL
jgi:site-specific recombinase XerD